MEHILITGGAGFIGSHLASHHIDKGDKVWIIDNLTTGNKENIGYLKLFRFDKAEVGGFFKLQDAVNWSDRIYHMAASVGMYNVLAHATETLSNNIFSLEKILKSVVISKKKIRVLVASSSGVYRNIVLGLNEAFHEKILLKIPSGEGVQECYALSKIVNEVMGLSYVEQKGVDCTIARIFNTIGPRQSSQYGMVVPRFIKQALKGEPITVYGSGLQTRSFCNVHDVVNALDLLLHTPKSKGEIFNVGNNETECSILFLAELIKEQTKSSSEIVFVPYKQAYGIDFKDVEQRKPSIDKLRLLTGFKPQWSLDQTIKEIIAFYQTNKAA